jgi:hypothetical protein
MTDEERFNARVEHLVEAIHGLIVGQQCGVVAAALGICLREVEQQAVGEADLGEMIGEGR